MFETIHSVNELFNKVENNNFIKLQCHQTQLLPLPLCPHCIRDNVQNTYDFHNCIQLFGKVLGGIFFSSKRMQNKRRSFTQARD